MNYAASYSFGKEQLITAHVPDAPLEARLLLEHVCHTTHHDLLAHGDRILSPEEETHYRALLQKRANRIPLSYLTGTAEFMGLPFQVNSSVLIPRADTEILVEEAIPLLTTGTRFLDLCTGSGCIALSLLHFCKGTSAVATDLSPDALQVARANAERLGLQARISFLFCDLFPAHRELSSDRIQSSLYSYGGHSHAGSGGKRSRADAGIRRRRRRSPLLPQNPFPTPLTLRKRRASLARNRL